MISRATFVAFAMGLVTSAALAGCGGSSNSSGSAEGGSAGSAGVRASTGGSSLGSGGNQGSGTVGTGGNFAGVSGAGSVGGEQTCCLAAPICNGEDKRIESEAACPAGAECYSSAACCSEIWCIVEPDPATCDAMPSCAASETRVNTCPAATSCTTHSLCGSTVLCAPASEDCDPATEPSRFYAVEVAMDCSASNFACPANTTPFGNDCGCGCEQPASCPEYVDCMPGIGLDPLCNAPTECPYTVRAM